VVSADSGSSNFPGKDIKTKECKADGIDDAALPLPVVTKNVILTREKIQSGI